MSNLYKRYNVISKDERVIDYNDVIREKIEKSRGMKVETNFGKEGFVSGLQADVVEALDADADFSAEADDAALNLIHQNNLESVKSEADEIIREANEDAKRLLEEAEAEAEEIKQQAYNDGMAQGLSNAQKQIDDQTRTLMMEYSAKESVLQKEYNEMKARIEPELVEVLTNVFEKVIGTIAEDNHEIIINLINSVIKNAENSKEFLIRVSPEDYKFVINNQGKIYCSLAKDIQMDIMEDTSLSKNECLIESESGVYNCSLDIQMENLIKNIKLLSCL